MIRTEQTRDRINLTGFYCEDNEFLSTKITVIFSNSSRTVEFSELWRENWQSVTSLFNLSLSSSCEKIFIVATLSGTTKCRRVNATPTAPGGFGTPERHKKFVYVDLRVPGAALWTHDFRVNFRRRLLRDDWDEDVTNCKEQTTSSCRILLHQEAVTMEQNNSKRPNIHCFIKKSWSVTRYFWVCSHVFFQVIFKFLFVCFLSNLVRTSRY